MMIPKQTELDALHTALDALVPIVHKWEYEAQLARNETLSDDPDERAVQIARIDWLTSEYERYSRQEQTLRKMIRQRTAFLPVPQNGIV